jgi:hypothetical protein
VNILLCERINQKYNQYIELLTFAYQRSNHNTILDVQNFLYSNFIPDFIHLQWPESIYRWRHWLEPNDESAIFLKRRLAFYSNNNVPIVYTVHNLKPHDKSNYFDQKIFDLIIDSSDIIVHHGKKSRDLFTKIYPITNSKIQIICPHGDYPINKVDPILSKRKLHLPLNKYIYLNFGIQKKYKGFYFLKNTFKELDNPNVFLFTIGNFVYDKKLEFIKKIISRRLSGLYKYRIFNSLQSKSKTIDTTVEYNQIPLIFTASDIVILGHQSGLNSGILSLAASYGKPIIFPNIGNFYDQLDGYDLCKSYEVANTNSAIELPWKPWPAKSRLFPPMQVALPK